MLVGRSNHWTASILGTQHIHVTSFFSVELVNLFIAIYIENHFIACTCNSNVVYTAISILIFGVIVSILVLSLHLYHSLLIALDYCS